MKAKKYALLWSTEPEKLEGEVNKLLDEGWELYGETSFRAFPRGDGPEGETAAGGIIYAQPMIFPLPIFPS
jgi:hypothetical protein